MKPKKQKTKTSQSIDQSTWSKAEAILAKAMAMEEESARSYNVATLDCGANADAATKKIFEGLVGDEEGHYDRFEKQCDNIKRFGLSYLALQSFDKGTAEPAPVAD